MIGNLKPIKLIQYTQTIDNNGDAEESVAVVYKMWAEVTDEGGSKSMEMGRTAMSDTKTFKINFRNYLVTGDYKIQYFGQVYAITNIKRIQEKRFNYELSGFNTFEASSGGVPDAPTNFETLTYNQATGILSFTDGQLSGALLQVLIKNPDGSNYVNNFGEQLTVGPGEFTELPYPLFTPPDQILVQWYLVDATTFQQLTGTNQLTINCTRLSERTFRIYQYNTSSVLPASFINSGCYPYNVNNQQLSLCVGIDQFIATMNADPINAQYFQITDYVLQTSGQLGPNYLLTVEPVSPYQQWNPTNTILTINAIPD